MQSDWRGAQVQVSPRPRKFSALVQRLGQVVEVLEYQAANPATSVQEEIDLSDYISIEALNALLDVVIEDEAKAAKEEGRKAAGRAELVQAFQHGESVLRQVKSIVANSDDVIALVEEEVTSTEKENEELKKANQQPVASGNLITRLFRRMNND